MLSLLLLLAFFTRNLDKSVKTLFAHKAMRKGKKTTNKPLGLNVKNIINIKNCLSVCMLLLICKDKKDT